MDKTYPSISVIIPTYNVAQYIERAITSALSQKDVNLEVIMIDDCSSDNTVAIAEQIQDPRLTIIRQPRNGGPSVARNAGIAAAQGAWIAILDGDDAFADTARLSRCLACAQQHNADIVVDNLLAFQEDTGATHTMFHTPLFQKAMPLTLADFIAGNQSFLGGYTLGYLKPLFRRDFMAAHALAYSTTIRIGEDYLLMAEALASGAICVTEPHAGYAYTVRSGSTSHRLNRDAVERIQKADGYFLSKYPLTGAALAAQDGRRRKLVEALAFTQLVDAIKLRHAASILRVMWECPSALFYLWRPIWVRAKKLAG